jgi:hypothetical protein
MKSNRYNKHYRENASKLHKSVGEILRSNLPFKLHRIYQEYPVSMVNPSYDRGAHTFDWVDLDLHMVIECHGEQHYKPVAFDGDMVAAESRYLTQKSRDADKAQAAIQMGWAYIEVPFDQEVTPEWILERYTESLPEDSLYNITYDITRVMASDPYREEKLEKARVSRHEHYLKMKELKNARTDH